jgi:geranylgeranyl pyrophosphate synthase
MQDRRSTTSHETSEESNPSSHEKEGQHGSATISTLLGNEGLNLRMKLINEEMKKFIFSERGVPSVLYDAAHHLLLAGGKRIRSLITLLCCEAVGGNVEEILPYAVATELLQTASLIHDDIIDEDNIRRGVSATHQKFGTTMAVLAGDLLVAQAIRLVGKTATPDLLVYLGSGGIRMCEGQAEDFLMGIDKPSSYNRQRYLSVIAQKTATFMKEAARIGAIIGKASKEQQAALSRYGEMLGFAFQIRDDILDVIASQQVVGKTVQSDIKSRRCNYPLVHALETCSEDERDKYIEAIENDNLGIVLELIEETKAIHHAIELTKTYVERSKNALEGYGFETESMLKEIADFVLDRIH